MLIEGHLKRRRDDDDDADDDALLLWSEEIKAVWRETKGGRDTNVTGPTLCRSLQIHTHKRRKKSTHLHIWPHAYFRGDSPCEQDAGGVV